MKISDVFHWELNRSSGFPLCSFRSCFGYVCSAHFLCGVEKVEELSSRAHSHSSERTESWLKDFQSQERASAKVFTLSDWRLSSATVRRSYGPFVLEGSDFLSEIQVIIANYFN